MDSHIVPLLAGAAQAEPPHPRSTDARRHRSTGSDRADASGPLRIHSLGTSDVRTVEVAGELDIAGRDLLVGCCCAGSEQCVVVDLSQLVFMDCCGYTAINQAGRDLDVEGRTLTLVGALGQPARLLQLIDDL